MGKVNRKLLLPGVYLIKISSGSQLISNANIFSLDLAGFSHYTEMIKQLIVNLKGGER